MRTDVASRVNLEYFGASEAKLFCNTVLGKSECASNIALRAREPRVLRLPPGQGGVKRLWLWIHCRGNETHARLQFYGFEFNPTARFHPHLRTPVPTAIPGSNFCNGYMIETPHFNSNSPDIRIPCNPLNPSMGSCGETWNLTRRVGLSQPSSQKVHVATVCLRLLGL